MSINLFKDIFIKNILKIFLSSSFSQIFPFILLPILTRIYTPSDFGLYGIYIFIFSILSVLSTGRLNNAIVNAKNLSDSKIILYSTFILLFYFVFLLSVLILIYHQFLNNLFFESRSILVYILPLTLLFSGLTELSNCSLNRISNFDKIAGGKIIISFFTAIIQLFFGFTGYNEIGLVLGFTISRFIGSIYLLISINFSYIKLKKLFLTKWWRNFYNSSNYIFFDIPSTFLSISSLQLPNYLFKLYFNQVFAGQFFFVQRLFQAPITLLSGSILEVFKSEAIKECTNTGYFSNAYRKTFKILFFSSFLPSILLYFFVEDLIVLIFGLEWIQAGKISQILILPLFLRFLGNPLSYSLYIREKQRNNMFLLTFIFICSIIIFLQFDSPMLIVRYLSYLYSIQYTIYIIYSYYLSIK